MPIPETTEWRYTASSGEVVRSDGVLIAREVPPEFGHLVEAAPVMDRVVNCAMVWRATRGASWDARQTARLNLLDALTALDAIARARQ